MIVAVAVEHELWRALSFAFGMTWEVLWALILGFALSGAVQAVVSKREMRRLMPDDSPKTLAIASGLGAASSSCSYASVALGLSAVVLVASPVLLGMGPVPLLVTALAACALYASNLEIIVGCAVLLVVAATPVDCSPRT